MVAQQERLWLVATDIYRAVVYPIPCRGYGLRPEQGRRATIPVWAATNLLQAIEIQKDVEEVRVRIEGDKGGTGSKVLGTDALPNDDYMTGGDRALIEIGSVRLQTDLWGHSSKVLELITKARKDMNRTLVVERRALLGALRRAELVGRHDWHRVVLEIGSEELEVGAQGDHHSSAEKLPIRLEGEPVRIAFNGRSLAQGLDIMRGEEVTLRMSGQLKPALLTQVKGQGPIYAIMPMQIM